VIRETDILDYGRGTDRLFKSNHRRRVREELKNPDVRQRRVEQAAAEMESLPPPHWTYNELKAWQQRLKVESNLSFKEVIRRIHALQQANATQAPATATTPPERAAKPLTLASPNLSPEIILKLSPDDALEVAESVTDGELRDALVKGSVGDS
jgi:hypothetical protein